MEHDIQDWWISWDGKDGRVFTCTVKTRGNIIIDAAPILKKWIGQSFSRMCSYYKIEEKEKI